MIVDLSREKERTEGTTNVAEAPKAEPKHEEMPKVQQDENNITDDKLSVLEKDLNTLKNLHDKELITDEEYEKLRAERINQHINKI